MYFTDVQQSFSTKTTYFKVGEVHRGWVKYSLIPKYIHMI